MDHTGRARALAQDHGYRFFEDDGSGSDEPAALPLLETEVKLLNRRLRSFGVSRDDLTLSALPNGHVSVRGNWCERMVERHREGTNPFGFRTAVASMPLSNALDGIRKLIPDWRD